MDAGQQPDVGRSQTLQFFGRHAWAHARRPQSSVRSTKSSGFDHAWSDFYRSTCARGDRSPERVVQESSLTRLLKDGADTFRCNTVCYSTRQAKGVFEAGVPLKKGKLHFSCLSKVVRHERRWTISLAGQRKPRHFLRLT